jgi:dCTP diphosphatase
MDDLRKAIRAFIEERDWEQFREEIGDVMIYLTELADKLGIDPVEAAGAKVEINGKKYPAALVRGNASKYTEYR